MEACCKYLKDYPVKERFKHLCNREGEMSEQPVASGRQICSRSGRSVSAAQSNEFLVTWDTAVCWAGARIL